MQGDTIGCLLDLSRKQVSYTKNGRSLGVAHSVGSAVTGQALFPAVCMKNAELTLNFGQQPFKHKPSNYLGIDDLNSSCKSSGKDYIGGNKGIRTC